MEGKWKARTPAEGGDGGYMDIKDIYGGKVWKVNGKQGHLLREGMEGIWISRTPTEGGDGGYMDIKDISSTSTCTKKLRMFQNYANLSLNFTSKDRYCSSRNFLPTGSTACPWFN